MPKRLRRKAPSPSVVLTEPASVQKLSSEMAVGRPAQSSGVPSAGCARQRRRSDAGLRSGCAASRGAAGGGRETGRLGFLCRPVSTDTQRRATLRCCRMPARVISARTSPSVAPAPMAASFQWKSSPDTKDGEGVSSTAASAGPRTSARSSGRTAFVPRPLSSRHRSGTVEASAGPRTSARSSGRTASVPVVVEVPLDRVRHRG